MCSEKRPQKQRKCCAEERYAFIHQRKEEEMGALTKQGEHLKGKWGSKEERKLQNENILDRKAKKDRRHAQEPRIMASE